MRQIEPEIIDVIFKSLDRQIEVHGGMPIGLVVCGGTALAALDLINRTTKDVDILGEVIEFENDLRIQKLKKFPKWLVKAAKIVERDYDLVENWLNLRFAPQLELGLPEGFKQRLEKRNYGQYLTIYFISRIDQIHFKLFASIDGNDYHVQDLLALNPTEIEIEKAARWIITQDVSSSFKIILKNFLNENGYESIAERL